MRVRPHCMLRLLLALALACGPAMGAIASVDGCTQCGGKTSVGRHATPHVAMHDDASHVVGQNGHSGKCPGCSSGCCKTRVCSGHACGAGVVALMTSYGVPLDLTSLAVKSTVQLVLPSERPTPLFRPPRT